MECLNIITQSEWVEISDALFYVRKSYNQPNGQSDVERLDKMMFYLNSALKMCGKVRERWENEEKKSR